MEVNIYRVLEGNLVATVVKLLEKAYSSGKRCVFYSPIAERVKVIDKSLWTFSTNVFIPHGDKTLGFCDEQPIYFTDSVENPNNSSILIAVDTFKYKGFAVDLEKVMFVFEDKLQLENAEICYQDLKKNNKNVNYWEQSKTGWVKLK